MTKVVKYAAITALAVALACAISARSIAAPPLQTKPCVAGDTQAPAVCGTFTVYEDRVAKSGRTIPLSFILIKAKHSSRHAIAFNPGGPGASATDDAALFADRDSPVASLRDRYDVLLLDNRGTGRSAPQQCDFAPAAHPELYFNELWPDALVKTCRDRLAAQANLSLYSTSVAADDLDDLRAALGYPKLALFGGSYGTRLYLAYARQHADRVESIILDGVAPPHFFILPVPMANGGQMAMNALIAACAADATCARNFPAFGAHFAELVRRFNAGPVSVSVQNSVTHHLQTVGLSKEVFAEALRHALYFPGEAAYVPVIVERGYRGDYKPLASLVDEMTRLFGTTVAEGLNLSVTCAEDIPFINEADVAKATADTFEGDARIRAQQRACATWNVQSVPPAFIDPVKSDLPIFMISGSDDPATPPVYARAALPFLSNAKIMLVKGASHDSDYPPCVYRAMTAFIRAGSTSGLDLEHCAASYRRPTFATLTFFDSAPGENAALTARFRRILVELLAGRIDRGQLTSSVSKQYPPNALKQFASEAAAFGVLQSFVYRGARNARSGKAYTYLAHFSVGNATMTVTVGADGRIAGLDVTPV